MTKLTKGFYGGKFLPFHRGHLHCILEASSQVDELYVIMFHSSREEKEILEKENLFGNKYLTPKIREMVIRKELMAFPHIKVYSLDTGKITEDRYDCDIGYWLLESLKVREIVGQFDIIFSNEESYDEVFKFIYPEIEHRMVDKYREVVSISGTEIRGMTTTQAYEYLPRAYQELVNKSVLIIGTESCGKTTLTQKLAKYFNTSYTTEFGREICEEYGIGDPDISLYPLFIYGQKMAEYESSRSANKVYFCDTEALVTNYYALLYENTTLPMVNSIVEATEYDVVIYLEPSNRWVNDGLRKHSDDWVRNNNNTMLLNEVLKYYPKTHILNGTYQENYTRSIAIVKKEIYGQ